MLQENSFDLQLILFAIVAVVAAFPELERERRGVIAAPALAAVPLAPTIALAAPKVAPAIALAPAPKLLAARKYFKYFRSLIQLALSLISKWNFCNRFNRIVLDGNFCQ